MSTKLVRIFPLDPRRGHNIERYRLAGSQYPTFLENKGWYEVDAETAQMLSLLRNNDNDPMSPHVFQVLDKEKAEAVEEAEKVQAAVVAAPIPLPRKFKKQKKSKKTPKQPEQ